MSSPQNTFVPVSRRPPDVEDYIDMIRRYRSWIIGPMFLGFVISTVIAFYWDDTYVSRATMKLTPQVVSPHLVANNASTELNERLTAITTQILSHSALIGIITDPAYNLYPKDRAKGKALEDVATDMVKDIHYQLTGVPIEMGNNHVASAFEIKYYYTDRRKAKMVVDKLVSMYEERNAAQQKDEARQTTTFVTEQLKVAQEKLAQADDAISKFTMENRGHLPTEVQSQFSELQGLRMRLQTANDQLATAQQNKMGLENKLTMLNQDEKAATASLTRQEQVQQTTESPRVQRLRQSVEALKLNLAAAKNIYKDDMPAVTTLQSQLDFANGELEKAEKEEADVAAQNQKGPVEVRDPLIAQHLDSIHAQQGETKSQIEQMNLAIRTRQQLIDDLQKDIIGVQRNIDTASMTSPEYSRLQRERDMAATEVQKQNEKQQGAAQQESLEDRQDGEKLEALDLANLPDTPFAPSREIWTTVGTVLGLLVGLVLAGAKEMKNTSLKNLKDVRAYTNLPVLSSVPLLENALLVRRKRRLFWLVWTSVFIVGLVCISASMYYHFVIRNAT